MTAIPQEVSAALEKIHVALTAERETNDQRLKEIEKHGAAMPETTAKVAKIEADIEALRTGIDESMKAMGRLSMGGGNGGDEKTVAALKADARLFFATKGAREELTEAHVEKYATYCDAFTKWVSRGGSAGETLSPEIRAELSVGSDTDGGLWVPSQMLSRVQTRLFETSDIRGIATVESTTSDKVELPIDIDEAATGGWVSEKQTRTETATPRVGIQTIETHEQYAEPHATQKLLDDANRDVEGWLAGKIADKLARSENTAFLTGIGVGQPRGILNYSTAAVTTRDSARAWGVLQYVASGSTSGWATISAGGSNPNTLIDLITSLKPVHRPNARFLMNRASEAVIRKMKDANGRYLVGMGDIRDGVIGFQLFGYPINTAEDMPDIASDAYALAFGDFKAYTIVDRQGIRVLRDPYTAKPFVKFYTTKRVGGDITDFEAIKLMKFATS